MALLPEEEEAFARLVAQLLPTARTPWALVVFSVVVVGEGVDGAVLLGVHDHLAIIFWVTFVLGLTIGLSCAEFAERRTRAFRRNQRRITQ